MANVDLIDRIAQTIRVNGEGKVIGASRLGEVIAEDLAKLADDHATLEAAVDAMVDDGWEETHDGGTLSRQDMQNIARVVLRAVFEGDR
jgi:hypothetical protein